MTVKELILELQKLDPDFDISIFHNYKKRYKRIMVQIDQLNNDNPEVILTGY